MEGRWISSNGIENSIQQPRGSMHMTSARSTFSIIARHSAAVQLRYIGLKTRSIISTAAPVQHTSIPHVHTCLNRRPSDGSSCEVNDKARLPHCVMIAVTTVNINLQNIYSMQTTRTSHLFQVPERTRKH